MWCPQPVAPRAMLVSTVWVSISASLVLSTQPWHMIAAAFIPLKWRIKRPRDIGTSQKRGDFPWNLLIVGQKSCLIGVWAWVETRSWLDEFPRSDARNSASISVFSNDLQWDTEITMKCRHKHVEIEAARKRISIGGIWFMPCRSHSLEVASPDLYWRSQELKSFLKSEPQGPRTKHTERRKGYKNRTLAYWEPSCVFWGPGERPSVPFVFSRRWLTWMYSFIQQMYTEAHTMDQLLLWALGWRLYMSQTAGLPSWSLCFSRESQTTDKVQGCFRPR